MQTLHTIEHNGSFAVRFANDAISLGEGERYVVALTLRQKPTTGRLPKVSVYGATFYYDCAIDGYVDDMPLVELDVTKIYFDDNDLVVEIHNGTTRNVDPLLFDVTW